MFTLMIKKAVLYILLFASFIAGAQTYKGEVFIDENKNGIFDNGEQLLQGVAVSDGKNVVETKKNGKFSLKGYSKTRFIFITVPAGYRASGKHYIRVNDSITNYDFGLIKYDRTKEDSKFIQITDTELHQYGEWVDDVKDYASNYNMGFIIHTGDICYVDGMNWHAANINTETMGLPVYYCIGNHDLVKGKYGEELFESLFGPVYYSFDAGNTHFVVTPMRHGDNKPSYTFSQVAAWLSNDLKHVDPEKNLVVFNHDLLTFNDSFVFKGRTGKKVILNNHNLVAWIYGHWHINFMKYHGDNGTVSVCSSPPDKGGINSSPSNFLVYDISKNGKVDVTPVYSYVDHQLVLNNPADSIVFVDDDGVMKIEAEIYDSKSKVKSAKATIYDNNGNFKIFELKPFSDWLWVSSGKISEKFRDIPLKMIFDVKFDDGTEKQLVRLFEIQKGNESVHTFNIPANIWMATPIVKGDKIFIGALDDFNLKNCGVYAFDINTGKQLWFFKTKGSVKNNFCYEDGKIYVTDNMGTAYSLDENSGKVIWQKDLGLNHLGDYNTGSTLENGVYYTGYGDYLQALDIKTGETIWKNTGWKGGEGNTATMTIAGDVLITGANWRALIGQDKNTGKVLWKLKKEKYSSRNSSATWYNDTLYVASQNGFGIVDPLTGELKEYFKEDKYNFLVATKPLILGELIILGTAKNGMVAFNRYTGEEIWNFKTGESLFYTSPYSKPRSSTVESAPGLIKGKLVFGASDGFVYILNPVNGALIKKINLGSPVLAPVSKTGDGFVVADFGGKVTKINID